MRRLVLLVTLIASSWPALAQYTPQSITTTSVATPAGCASIDVTSNKGAVGFYVGGTWTGTLTPEVAIQGQPANSAAASYVIPSTSSTTQATITANGIYFFPSSAIAGASTAYVCGPTATGTALIWLNSSTALNVPPGSGGGGGGVTAVTGTSPIISSGGTTPAISCPTCLTTSAGPSFANITSGTNTTAAMVVGTGASLGTSGTGTNTANQLATITTVPDPTTIQDAATNQISFSSSGLELFGGGGGGVNFPTGDGFEIFNGSTNVFLQSDLPSAGNFTLGWGTANTLIGTAGALTSNVGFTTSGAFSGGTFSGTSVTGTGLIKGNQLQSTVATGTAPLIVASTTNVANLNASSLSGATFAAPGAIGTTTAGVVKTTTLEVPNVLCSSSSPSISSGFGTTPSIPNVNGSCSFTLNVGTGGTASSGVIAMNSTATTGWNCDVHPNGTPQAAAVTYSAPTSTTSVTLTNYTQSTGVALAWTAGLVFNVSCFGY